jgi:DNA-binding transcriptional LysR family regulator
MQQQSALLREVAEVAVGGGTITLACQHAISATVSPSIVRALSGAGFEPVRIRSGNQDECLLMLLSGAADLVISYAASDVSPDTGSAFEVCQIGQDRLIPVAAPGLERSVNGALPVVSYPSDVFFGGLVARLWSSLPEGIALHRRIETALTLAAYRYAVEALAVAWLPQALVQPDLDNGRLQRVAEAGPELPLDIRMLRLTGSAREGAQRGWDVIRARARAVSEGLPQRAPDLVEAIGRAEQ